VREVPLKQEIVEAINEYLVGRSSNPFADSGRLIVGQRGVLQRDAINTLLEKLTVVMK
jgi:integrase/recombinase XerD